MNITDLARLEKSLAEIEEEINYIELCLDDDNTYDKDFREFWERRQQMYIERCELQYKIGKLLNPLDMKN